MGMKMPDGKALVSLGIVGTGAAAALLGAHALQGREKIGPLPTAWALAAVPLAASLVAGKKLRGGLFLLGGGAFLVALLGEVRKRLEAPATTPAIAGQPFAVGQLGDGAALYALPPPGFAQAYYPQMYQAAGL